MPKPSRADIERFIASLSEPEKVVLEEHLEASEWAKATLADLRRLSPIVNETTRTTVTSHDANGRISTTAQVKIPAHKRNFDALARKRLASARKLLASKGVRSSYFDTLVPLFASHAFDRLKLLAREPHYDAFWGEAAKWVSAPVSFKFNGRTYDIRLSGQAGA